MTATPRARVRALRFVAACAALLCVATSASAQLLPLKIKIDGSGLGVRVGRLQASVAQPLPVRVQVQGDLVLASIGPVDAPLAELLLEFEDATNLTASNIGVTAVLANLTDPLLQGRLDASTLTSIPSALPLLISVEPPSGGGLVFKRTVNVEVHTHLLPYTLGTSLRLFKAQLDAPFRDITYQVASGSVRARGKTAGFSQFLVLLDLRDTGAVIASKTARLHSLVDLLPAAEAAPLRALADEASAAVAGSDFVLALDALDRLDARVRQRAGVGIPEEWRATRDVTNVAGELLAESATLRFSIGFLRDFGP